MRPPIAILVLIALLSRAQGIDPSEIRVKSQPYLARTAYTVRVDTRLVEIGVVVRGIHGRAATGLTRENFQIHDNGKEREIENFAVDETSPASAAAAAPAKASEPEAAVKSASKPDAARSRFIALFIDDVNAKDGQHANDLKETRDAAQRFVKEALRPGVAIGVFTASGAQRVDFTEDPAKLLEAIAGLQGHPRLTESTCLTPYLAYLIAVRHDSSAVAEVTNNRDLDKKPFAYQCRGTPVSQAEEIWRQAREVSAQTLESIGRVTDHLGSMPGSRVLLVASSGFLTATLEMERDLTVSRALRAGVVINALDSKGLYEWLAPDTKDVRLTQMGGQATVRAGLEHNQFETVQMGLRVDAMNEPLATLAEGTGGVFFHDNNNLTAGFRELAAPPEVVYRLSFRPRDAAADGAYHKLKIKVVNAKYESVQARPGYFAPSETPAAESGPSNFDREVTAKDTVGDFPVTLTGENGKPSGAEIGFTVVANIDISKLNFARQGGRRTQKIRLVSALMDAHGAIVAAKEATLDLMLKEDTYQRLTKTGLNAKLTLQAPPGVYNLREVVEESGGALACSTNAVEIR